MAKTIEGSTLIMTVKLDTTISWADAFKLRLAGGRYVHEFIKAQLTRYDKSVTPANPYDAGAVR